MPTHPIAHFLIGAVTALAIFLLFSRLSGERSFSLPSAVIFIGLACASLSHFLSPWATPAVLLLYLVGSIHELREERRMRQASRNQTGQH